MKQIGNVVISDSVWNAKFACDIERCKGKCCQYGDLGAPITQEEENSIKKHLSEIDHLISKRNMKLLKSGITETFRGNLHIIEGGKDTPCPLSYTTESGIVMCTLHKQALDTQQPILNYKPLWCTLFPLMIKQVPTGWLINCYFNDFCVSVDNPPPLLIAFEDTLTSIFGADWMKAVHKEYQKNDN